MSRYAMLLGSTLLTFSALSHAGEQKLQPGLWEISASSNLLSLVEQVPPDQRRHLGNLAKQYGFTMPDIKDGAARSRICVSPEMAARDIAPTAFHRQSGCEARNAKRAGNHFSADLVCDGEQVNGRGTTEATLTDPQNFTGRTTFKGLVHGVAVDEQATTSGHWLAQECPVDVQRY